ncbi:Uncharacterised protein [Streptococcus pneumoniae]|nr:Uncharacterised protein [Streptococcus pneumoniae]COL61698.1 Uncharacterised protein [Streptococcus pneumoniae]
MRMAMRLYNLHNKMSYMAYKHTKHLVLVPIDMEQTFLANKNNT